MEQEWCPCKCAKRKQKKEKPITEWKERGSDSGDVRYHRVWQGTALSRAQEMLQVWKYIAPDHTQISRKWNCRMKAN